MKRTFQKVQGWQFETKRLVFKEYKAVELSVGRDTNTQIRCPNNLFCWAAYSDLTLNPDRTFTAVSIQSTCTQSIPIPLASVTYHWSGCAINTLTNHIEPDGSTSTWLKSTGNGCPEQTLGTPGLTSQFPTWTTLGNY